MINRVITDKEITRAINEEVSKKLKEAISDSSTISEIIDSRISNYVKTKLTDRIVDKAIYSSFQSILYGELDETSRNIVRELNLEKRLEGKKQELIEKGIKELEKELEILDVVDKHSLWNILNVELVKVFKKKKEYIEGAILDSELEE